jgi:hypothetical protein
MLKAMNRSLVTTFMGIKVGAGGPGPRIGAPEVVFRIPVPVESGEGEAGGRHPSRRIPSQRP